jgi:sulfite exporter TauE/SafE
LNLPLLFAMGIAGTLHCAAMCGPLAVLAGGRVTGVALYLTGKGSSYVLLGALAGALGHSVLGVSAGARILAIAAGALLIVAGLHSLGVIRDSMVGVGLLSRAAGSITALAGQGNAGKLVLGVGNGFLPCPMTYAFVAMAAATASPIYGAATMAVLGVTSAVPLAIAAIAAGRIALFARLRLPLWSGALMLAAAAITLYRGFAPAAAHSMHMGH